MLLLPLTPPLIYLKLKRFKGPKMDFTFFTFFTFTFTSTRFARFSVQEVEVVGEGRWLLHSQSKKVLKENTARARLARVWINWNHLQFYKRNPFKNESDQKKSCQKIAIAFHFTKDIPLKFFRENKKYHQKILKRRLIYNFISHGVITTKGRGETFYVGDHFWKKSP